MTQSTCCDPIGYIEVLAVSLNLKFCFGEETPSLQLGLGGSLSNRTEPSTIPSGPAQA